MIDVVRSADPAVRNRSIESLCAGKTDEGLLAECAALDVWRREAENLYERVRALFLLSAVYRFRVGGEPENRSFVRYSGYQKLLGRRFEEAIDDFLETLREEGPGLGVFSALAEGYRSLGFQTLADQVRQSVRSARGNAWMFRMGHPSDHPLRIVPQLAERMAGGGFPLLREFTAVRMDLSHSAWSDIFFLGMDFPEGARVINVSVDLALRGGGASPRPPVEATFRVIDKPVIRLVSVDLGASVELSDFSEVFDFAADYLGLLRAAVISSGLVPPGVEGSGQRLEDLLEIVIGPGLGFELVSNVNNIPKGSRLAVSTNLLAALIAVCMRATGQTAALDGPLEESDRRMVAARAILGEWIGGSGGGWQDSGGVWPGIKLIEGVCAKEGDPEDGISRGALLPRHSILGRDDVSDETRRRLQESLVLVHGGLAQNVGPILEMVTERYLLRSEVEWQARQEALKYIDGIVDCLRKGDIQRLGELTHRNFYGPIQTIIPWATNLFTERLIEAVRKEFGRRFWGFWMLGGMSGGGMGFIFDPASRSEGEDFLQRTMLELKRELESALPFAMDPVVYEFSINERGSSAVIVTDGREWFPPSYYALTAPDLIRRDPRKLSLQERADLECFRSLTVSDPAGEYSRKLCESVFPETVREVDGRLELERRLEDLGFDRESHESIRADMRAGRIGLAQNRLPASTVISDVNASDVIDLRRGEMDGLKNVGLNALREGRVAVVTLAGGVGSRWTQGAGVIKALSPFARFDGRHRTFAEVHLAKNRATARMAGRHVPHVFTTSYLTYGPLSLAFEAAGSFGFDGPVRFSRGSSIGLRMIPMVRDLRFHWEETSEQQLDERAQKVRESLRDALVRWARSAGEGEDYVDNLPNQCLHPVGHWYEVPNLLLNGTLKEMLSERPELQTLMLHNVDTLGANVDPAMLGAHLRSGNALSFEVIERKLDDRGGGLARVNGRVRLVEGLAMPREEDEFRLSYYNSMTTWIEIDALLTAFGLCRSDLSDPGRVAAAVRAFSRGMPTYITLKDVKKRWGRGQEDVFPVAQFEKLWSDVSGRPELNSGFLLVPRFRGQQLKDPAQLDGWLRDGSAAYVDALCAWE